MYCFERFFKIETMKDYKADLVNLNPGISIPFQYVKCVCRFLVYMVIIPYPLGVEGSDKNKPGKCIIRI